MLIDADWLTTAVLLAFCGTMFVGVRRWRAAGGRYPWWRGACLVVGVLCALAVLDTSVSRLARTLMSVLSTQDLVLLLLSPALIVFGRPQDALAAAFPRVALPPGLRRVLRAVAHPMVGPLLVPIVLGVLVFTPLLGQIVRHEAVNDVVHLALIGIGVLIAAPLARDPGGESSLAVGLALAVGIVELFLDAGPGFFLRMDDHVLPPIGTLAVLRGSPPSALFDQHLAGAILWTVADVLDLPFLILVVRRWMRVDAAEAHIVDQALDRAEEADDATSARPWWETDPRVFGEERARRFGADG